MGLNFKIQHKKSVLLDPSLPPTLYFLSSVDPFDGVLRKFTQITSGKFSKRSTTMLRELTLIYHIAIPTKDLDNNGPIHQRSLVATQLLKTVLHTKSSKKHGYYLTVTNLKIAGKERINEYTIFPVIFTCRTFTPCAGETMLGVVHCVRNAGVFLRYGPIIYIFLSNRKMSDYHYFVPGEKAAFLNDSLSRIDVGVVVRFRVLDAKWVETAYKTRRDFHVLATLEGDSLGPVSLCGGDELDLW